MRRFQSTLASFAVAVMFLLSPPATAATMSAEIDHLLNFIATSPCAFVRNGVTYDGEAAADHIKEKYEYYKSEIRSAEDFIALAASKSVLSGRPYLVQCDASAVPAAAWLAKELTAFRQRP